MNVQHTLSLEIDTKDPAFTLMVGDHPVKIKFMDALNDAFLGAQDNAMAYKVSDTTRALVYTKDQKAVLMYSTDTATPTVQSLFIEGLTNIETHEGGGKGRAGQQWLFWKLIDGRLISYTNQIATFSTAQQDMRWEFSLESEAPTFQMMTAPKAVAVPSTKRGPEFSIGVFDGYDPVAMKWLRPRPIRLGVPVISTVPVYDLALSEDDLEYYNNGSGPMQRKMHFRVICNQPLSVDVPVHLMLSLPNGLDTVALPIPILLQKITLTSGQTPNVYYGNYTFQVEDTINWVDGFAYMSVHVPLVQQIALPIMIQVDNTSVTSFTSTVEDETVF